MDIGFFGAARTVTGSKYRLRTDYGTLLIDFGMFQGSSHPRHQNRADFPSRPEDIDYVLLTHAHIDHSGLLPRFVAAGFNGPIISTDPTHDLCEIMLADSAHIQEEDAKWDMKEWREEGRVGPPPEPLYTTEDVGLTLDLFQSVKYDEMMHLNEGLRVRFRDAGHILGSASIELWIGTGDDTTKLVFSGDIGGYNRPILRDPQEIDEADYLVVESTYGNRLHPAKPDHLAYFESVISDVMKRGGHLVIPAFAVGRTQEVLYDLNLLQQDGKLPHVPVYLDSPLAIKATEILRDHEEVFDREALSLLESGNRPTDFRGLQFTRTVDESKEINVTEGPFIVISASGMCTAGRVRHHLKRDLPDPNNAVMLVGYQAAGTLGRILQDGVERVKLFGEWLPVNADIHTMSGFSAHADMRQMLKWMSSMTGLKGVFVTHGEDDAALDFAGTVHRRFDLDVCVPQIDQVVDLSSSPINQCRIQADQEGYLPPSEAEQALQNE
ncbi:MAG: MBL fold metallo-hydrolase RNA specificity domain-containing protein [Armatimonadota bacterium]